MNTAVKTVILKEAEKEVLGVYFFFLTVGSKLGFSAMFCKKTY